MYQQREQVARRKFRGRVDVKNARAILFFAGHELLSTIGVPVLAAFLTFSIAPLLPIIGPKITIGDLRAILTGTHYFPIQISLGFLFGFLAELLIKQRMTTWVWVLPAVALLIEFVFLRGASLGDANRRFLHFFGSSCRPQDHCFDQLAITLPFYCSVAYSIGAFVCRMHRQFMIGRHLPLKG